MRVPPVVKAMTSSTVTVEWEEWTQGVDIGDGPVVAYVVYLNVSGIWQELKTVDHHITSAILDGLEPETDYGICLAATREGNGGTGPKSRATTVTTPCRGNRPTIFYDIPVGFILGTSILLLDRAIAFKVTIAVYECLVRMHSCKISLSLVKSSQCGKTCIKQHCTGNNNWSSMMINKWISPLEAVVNM